MGVVTKIEQMPIVQLTSMEYINLSTEDRNKDVIYEITDYVSSSEKSLQTKLVYRGSVPDMKSLIKLSDEVTPGTIAYVLETEHVYLYMGGTSWEMMDCVDEDTFFKDKSTSFVKCNYCGSEVNVASETVTNCPNCGAPLKLIKGN